TTSSISILEISVWASPDSLTSGSLVINELVALDLTMCVEKIVLKVPKKLILKIFKCRFFKKIWNSKFLVFREIM
ncbi:hypothetical protein, partial [Streptococcus suis]|uniref:hypothetical protein n=1 Tax=Streptococcus suis TaxID=1307 RepID=UPI001EDDEA46